MNIFAKQLNAFIHQSNFKPGDKLPNVTQLKERYQVSKSTIIKALGLLEQDGLISTIKHKAVVFMWRLLQMPIVSTSLRLMDSLKV